ncbi:anti-sigma factor [Flavobacterium sp. RSSB_23]|uniref:anti-sigma factor n=1 Tax=Flavobacterium sp. RSSB_23 TaxID=3447668 RepID=UPI003F2EA874
METKEYIASGILELYVYGLLSETENLEVAEKAKQYPEIEQEIIAIEKSIVALSSSFSPFQSVANYEKIKNQLALKHGKVIEMQPQKKWTPYLGWAAAAVLFVGIGFQYFKLNETQKTIVVVANEKKKIEQEFSVLDKKNKAIENSLAIVRDVKNTLVALSGQTVSPTSYAKVYWNKQTQTTYVDASGLPKPPKGMVYQVWAIKLSPTLTPKSIGLLGDFENNEQKLFEVDNTDYAEAFGITLEPEGGSATPTMEQLYTLGKV